MKLTDAEITRRLAEGVMGWRMLTSVDNGFPAVYVRHDDRRVHDWQPITNESHAAEVRERLRALGYEVSMVYSKRNDWVEVCDKRDVGVARHGKHGTMCRLTAECALLALGLATEEEL